MLSFFSSLIKCFKFCDIYIRILLKLINEWNWLVLDSFFRILCCRRVCKKYIFWNIFHSIVNMLMHYAYNNVSYVLLQITRSLLVNIYSVFIYMSIYICHIQLFYYSLCFFLYFFFLFPFFFSFSCFNFLFCVLFRCTKLKFVQKIQEKFASIDNYSTRISTHSKKFITCRSILYFLYN